jgi:DNA polymerase III subunit delta
VPQINNEALLSVLEKRPGGAFFVSGDEGFLREEAIRRIVDAHLDAATRDFNLDAVRGDDVGAEGIASILATPPMMAEFRVVVIRDAQQLGQKARDAVEAVALAPPPGLVLVISAVIPTSSKAKFYSVLQKAAVSVDFRSVDPLDAPGWLIERARADHGMEVEPEGARALVSAVGTDLRTLATELEKIGTYLGERKTATRADVEALTGVIARADRWQWFDLVADQKFAEAFHQVPTLIAAGENGVGLVIGLGSQLLRIGLVCAGGAGALERELKPYQRWLTRRIVPQARRWNTATVDAALGELLRSDRLLKSASLTDRQAMEELVLRIQAVAGGRKVAA